ncbi:MAG: lactonase family protein [Chitinophagales bacterium]
MRIMIFLIGFLLSISGFSQEYYLFVGTYTNGKSKGIYVYDFNAATGKSKPISEIASKNPSYLVVSPNGKYVYAVNENGNNQSGAVSAFSFDKVSGQLQFINSQSSGGADPCYISENKDARWILVANYSGGSLAALAVRPDGSLDSAAQIIQHIGSGVNKERQEMAHVHSVVLSPDEHWLYAADLGMDKESVYQFDPGKKTPLSPTKDSVVSLTPGSGPRHFTFHPIKPYAYLINELSGTVNAFKFDKGQLKLIQEISSHPANYQGEKGSADIHISPDGKFLYATNRGDANSIAIYSIDQSTGKLQLKGIQSTMGKHPRNFMIDPTGHFLLIANRDSDSVVVFRIDSKTGLLTASGDVIEIPNPVCLKMLKKCTTCNPKPHRKKHR